MRTTPAKTIFSLIFAALLFCANVSFGQKEFLKLSTSTDSTYGYTAQHPLLLKKGNPQKSINYSYSFLKGLRTQNGQTLTLLSRTSTSNPNYKEPDFNLSDRFTGTPLSGDLGMLDVYEFVTSNTKDTVTLYVDIYNKGALQLPVGLKYEQPGK